MSASDTAEITYRLDDQVGYLLRLAGQRHSGIFQSHVPGGLTPTQFSALLRLSEHGEVSQNHLGRLAAMDIATIKGVVDRLRDKGLIVARSDPDDRRRSLIALSPTGTALIDDLKSAGRGITEATLAPLTDRERASLVTLLKKIT